MPPVLLIPLRKSGRHVHFLDNVPPAYAGIVGTEGNFAFLRRVWNNALLGPPEVVVEQILEPHAGNEQEVPTVFAAPLDIVQSAVRSHFAVAAALGFLGHSGKL